MHRRRAPSVAAADDEQQERRLDDVDAGDDGGHDQRQRMGERPARAGGERGHGQEREAYRCG